MIAAIYARKSTRAGTGGPHVSTERPLKEAETVAGEMSGDLLALSAMVDILFSEVIETRKRLRA